MGARLAKAILGKIITGANTAFFGYEVGSFVNEPAPQIIYNSTIITKEPKRDDDNTHFYFVIGFLIVIILLICLSWALKIIIKVKTNQRSNEIELRPVQNANQNQVRV